MFLIQNLLLFSISITPPTSWSIQVMSCVELAANIINFWSYRKLGEYVSRLFTRNDNSLELTDLVVMSPNFSFFLL